MLPITRMREPWSVSWALATPRCSPTSAFQRVWGQQLPQFSLTFTPCSVSGSRLQLQRLDSIPVIFPTNSLSLEIFLKTFSFYYFKQLLWFECLYLRLPCDLNRNGLRTRVLQAPFTVQKNAFSEGVCSFQRVHHEPGCYSGTGDWINKIGCLHHEARVPED